VSYVFLYVLTTTYTSVQVLSAFITFVCLYVSSVCITYLSNTLLIITSTWRKSRSYISPGTTLHSELLSKLISAHFRKLSYSLTVVTLVPASVFVIKFNMLTPLPWLPHSCDYSNLTSTSQVLELAVLLVANVISRKIRMWAGAQWRNLHVSVSTGPVRRFSR
jgi:hypothetical protein